MTGENGRLPAHMSEKAPPRRRHRWASSKGAKPASEERQSGYREAKETFEPAERVRQAREHFGLTQAELAA